METTITPSSQAAKPFRVLTLDGGGMRGLYTATLLQVLAKRFDERFHEKDPDIGRSFDLICGTSTGAILACALAVGIPLSHVKRLYIEHGPHIFARPMPQGKKLYMWAFKHRAEPAANAQVLEDALTDCFCDMTLAQAYEKRGIALCIPTITAVNYRARVLKTPHNTGKHRDNNYRLVDVCMASAAAPIFFPLAERTPPNDEHTIHHFVDGGLWANNPVLVGLTEALGMVDADVPIEIVSMGTCDQPSGDPHKLNNVNWGLKDWQAGVRIVEMSLAAQAFGTNATAKFLAQCLSGCGRSVKVVRLKETNKSPEHYSAIGLDRADEAAIRALLSLAEADADHNHSRAMSAKPGDLKLLKDIFRNLQAHESNNLNPQL